MKFYECKIPAVTHEIYRRVHIGSISVLCAHGELGDAMSPASRGSRQCSYTLLIRYYQNINEKPGFRSWNWANLYFDCLVFNQKYRCANMTWYFFDFLSSYEKGWEPHLDHTLDMKFIFCSIRFIFLTGDYSCIKHYKSHLKII